MVIIHNIYKPIYLSASIIVGRMRETEMVSVQERETGCVRERERRESEREKETEIETDKHG